MAENKKEKKGFWKEFREFLNRGNILDLAVGVIVGGAFSAIVTALCDNILKPIINWVLALIMGSDSLTEVYTFLVTGYDETGAVDLAASIYIDWGTFINAVINFLLIALVLFLIIKALMKMQTVSRQAKEGIETLKKNKEDEAAAGESATAAEPEKKE